MLAPPETLAVFRSLHYGFTDPEATICLWWTVALTHRVHVRSEMRRQACTIETLCRDIQAQTRELELSDVRYTVADEDNIGKEIGDGETRANTFARNGVPLLVIKPDPIQGWTLVRELFGLRTDGKPWLTIDPSCVHLIRALTSAMQDKSNPEDVMDFTNVQPLKALRVGAMSRPTPKATDKPELPKNAIGRDVERLRNPDPSSTLVWR